MGYEQKAWTERQRGFSESLRILSHGLFDRFKVFNIPTNAGWSTSNAGSGAVYQTPFYLEARTGTTANSRALAYAYLAFLNRIDGHRFCVCFDGRLEMHFNITRANSDSECIARIQLKEGTSWGALSSRGLGIEIQNYTMIGEAYGTSRGTVSLGTLTNLGVATLSIILVPQTRVEFWVNRVKVGELTGASVPTGTTAATYYLNVGIANSSTGGVDAVLNINNIWIVQEW